MKKFTQLQLNDNIYKQIYVEVHKEVLRICEERDDGDHLLLSRFNEAQANVEEFKKSFLDLFYTGNTFGGNYLKMTATDFYLEQTDLNRKTFTEEFVMFMAMFENK